MKKEISILIVCFTMSLNFAQKKIGTNSGTILFEASIPAFEEVKASNNNVSCIIKTATGEITCLAFISEFHFKMAMMKEHFNANYLESHKYPKATFKGTIKGFNMTNLGIFPNELSMTGKLSMHGKSKNITTVATIQKTENGLQITSNFKVNASDFKIKIPKIVQYKVAEIVTIKTNFILKKLE